MSSDVVIQVEQLGKKYRICHQQQRQRYLTLRDALADKTTSVARRLWSLAKNQKAESGKQKSVEDFWALKDVSFEVKQGETLGIIGRNGAGKSTLLKILSRITDPTEGRVRIKGRVASLLEVGTGFHPELTGGENIFLNGAILGMSRAEIKSKFDEIVAFAEVEKFLDTPVKRYSRACMFDWPSRSRLTWSPRFSSWMKFLRLGMRSSRRSVWDECTISPLVAGRYFL